jgi:hypothetical protein
VTEQTGQSESTFLRRRPYSLFFPLLLIGVGVVLFLKTFGVIEGNLWDLFLKTWPVLLIVSGLDSLYKRESIVGGVVWTGLGALLLLANLGYLPAVHWDVILRVWPFALVVWGLDILLHRRNWLNAGVGLLAGVVLVAVIYWVMISSPVAAAGQIQPFETQPGNATQAAVTVETITGRLLIGSGADAANLADGEIQLARGEDYHLDYTVAGSSGELLLKSETTDGVRFWFPGANTSREWQVNLSGSIPLDLKSTLIVGEQTADLSGLQIEDAELQTILGRSVITLPVTAAEELEFSLVMGEMVVRVPTGLALQVELDTAITTLDYPDDFVRQGDILLSPGAETSSALHIRIELPIGSLRIEYID